MMRFVLLFLGVIHFAAWGQDTLPKWAFYHLDKVTVKEKVSTDSATTSLTFKKAINQFKLAGYTGVKSGDTLYKKGNVHYYFKAEKQFKQIYLADVNDPKQRNTYRSKGFITTAKQLNGELVDLENNGYPFAQIEIVDQKEEENTLTLFYNIDSGAFYSIEKIHIKSSTPFHEKTVLNIMNLKPGDVYNESKIKNLPEVFKSSGKYTVPKAPEVLFLIDKAELYVYIEKKRASNADGYVGFQQDQITQRLALNGYINLELNNALNRAEIIHLNWRNNPEQTQDLKSTLEYPYLFGSPFGIGADINLQKQDTSFIRSNILLELTYRNPKFRAAIFNEIESSNILTTVPINGFRDYAKNTIGVSLWYGPFLPEKLDFYHPYFGASGGVFTYRSDTSSNEAPSIANRKYKLTYGHKIDFLKFFHLNNVLTYQGLTATTGLARNELIYFGGLQTLRGFYELELAAKELWMLRNEVVFQPMEQLELKVLYDYSTFTNGQLNQTNSVGFGFGLINNNSQLEIIIANGILNNNPFDLADTKVHIGFKSNF